ncbi:MAG TPA: hypothetical protein VK951_02630 [Miltoncostaeaceae bacterium]|nr:hypothetical protein [Miltoncostaeaceae bacterium]
MQHDVGHLESVAVLGVGETSRSRLVERQRAEADGAQAEREGEERPGAGGRGRRAQRGPADEAWAAEVGLGDGPAVLVRVDARSLAEGVLQVLDAVRDGVRGAQGSGTPIRGDDRGGGSGDAQDLDAAAAGAVRRAGALTPDRGEDSEDPLGLDLRPLGGPPRGRW